MHTSTLIFQPTKSLLWLMQFYHYSSHNLYTCTFIPYLIQRPFLNMFMPPSLPNFWTSSCRNKIITMSQFTQKKLDTEWWDLCLLVRRVKCICLGSLYLWSFIYFFFPFDCAFNVLIMLIFVNLIFHSYFHQFDSLIISFLKF